MSRQLYFDKLGLICSRHTSGVDEIGRPIDIDHPWLDGGDSANRTLAEWNGKKLSGENIRSTGIRHLLTYLQCPHSKGNYRRHPDPLFWYSKDNVNSRDQDIQIVIAMGLFDQQDMLKDYFNAHKKRMLLFTTNTRRNGSTPENHGLKYHDNARDLRWYEKLIVKHKIPLLSLPEGYRNYNWKLPDPTLFEFWGLYIRAFKAHHLKPLLLISDLFLVLSALTRRKSKDEDVVNHCAISAYSVHTMPTKLSRLACRINNAEDLSNKLKRFYTAPVLPFFLATTWTNVCNKYFNKETNEKN